MAKVSQDAFDRQRSEQQYKTQLRLLQDIKDSVMSSADNMLIDAINKTTEAVGNIAPADNARVVDELLSLKAAVMKKKTFRADVRRGARGEITTIEITVE